jgi:uncharacterized membrane protein YdjX (TVP38/TMEM64 family)
MSKRRSSIAPEQATKGQHIEQRKAGWWRPVALIGLVILIMVLAHVFKLGARLGELQDWIKGLGMLGYLVFVIIYVVATVFALPGSVLTIAAGALFGSVIGVILVSIAATIGASLAFLVARYFAQDATERWLSKSEKFKKLNNLTEQHGAIVVAITRLVPIFPFNLLNYGFGLTKVRFWTYVFWSWLCMLPGTILYVVGTDTITTAVREGRVPWVLVVALVIIIAVVVIITRAARRKLQEKEAGTDLQKHSGEEKTNE